MALKMDWKGKCTPTHPTGKLYLVHNALTQVASVHERALNSYRTMEIGYPDDCHDEYLDDPK